MRQSCASPAKDKSLFHRPFAKKAGLLPHTEVEFHYVRGQVVLKPISKPLVAGEEAISPIRAAIRRARGSANEPMFKGWSTDQIMAFLRGDD